MEKPAGSGGDKGYPRCPAMPTRNAAALALAWSEFKRPGLPARPAPGLVGCDRPPVGVHPRAAVTWAVTQQSRDPSGRDLQQGANGLGAVFQFCGLFGQVSRLGLAEALAQGLEVVRLLEQLAPQTVELLDLGEGGVA